MGRSGPLGVAWGVAALALVVALSPGAVADDTGTGPASGGGAGGGSLGVPLPGGEGRMAPTSSACVAMGMRDTIVRLDLNWNCVTALPGIIICKLICNDGSEW